MEKQGAKCVEVLKDGVQTTNCSMHVNVGYGTLQSIPTMSFPREKKLEQRTPKRKKSRSYMNKNIREKLMFNGFHHFPKLKYS